MRARILVSSCTDPYRNLAYEEALLLTFDESNASSSPGTDALGCGAGALALHDEIILFIWQNDRSVIIGRGQNAWRECRSELLESDGVKLARRTTGGGAVYHDLGNINFSFLLSRSKYDLTLQLSVVRQAIRACGIDCVCTGRNDLSVGGKKISGNAFRFTENGALHHGTLLVSTDTDKMMRYLSAPKQKLSARVVQSTPTEVVNLSALANVTVEKLKKRLCDAFHAVYGPAESADIKTVQLADVEALAERNASWDWNYGSTPAFDVAFANAFSFGHVELQLTLREGRVAACRAFTDSMDPEFSARMEKMLSGCAYDAEALGKRVGGEVGVWLAGISL